MKSKQICIFITVFHSFVSKNILNSDFFLKFRDSGKYKLVLLVPQNKETYFKEHYAHKNVVIETVSTEEFVQNPTEIFFDTIAKLLIDTHYLHYRRREILEKDKSFLGTARHKFREMVVRNFADKPWAHKVYYWLDNHLNVHKTYAYLFAKYSPALVFATDIFDQCDSALVKEAKRNRIKVVGMVRSWDNCLSKGLLRSVPDVVVVNNVVLKEELVSMHHVPPDAIRIIGLPQFDSFINLQPEERNLFFKKHGLDPKKRLVMFAPAGNILSNTDSDILDILIKAKKNGPLPEDIQFFVRNHPHHPADFSACSYSSDVHIQTPGEILDPTTNKATELTVDDLYFLRNILAHTDVLIWVATSLCLDALVYDVPEVVVNFDGYVEKAYYHSVKRYHDEDHMKKMFLHKPFRVANNATDLVESINIYLKDRSIDARERDIVRVEQLFKTDGRAGERLVNLLQEEIASR